MTATNNKNYLIIPAMPTPNGGFHLGHIGGPYLGADILARYLRLTGNNVVLLSGSDVYESFVQLQAETEDKSIAQICEQYHAVISRDLMSMHIHLDQFINPLTSEWREKLSAWHERILKHLRDKQVVTSRSENLLWDTKNQRYVTGCWLDGECPYCQTEIRGYFCDECGGHFRPEQVKHQYHFPNHSCENLFMRIPDMCDLSHMGINADIQERYQYFLQQQNNMIRLSANSSWGLECAPGKTYFSYSFVYAYYLCLGEIAGAIFNTNKNAFAADSDVVTIATFGVDNAVPVLASVLGISANYHDYKPVDYYLVNYFYYLNDAKFSTSRRNAVWVRDMVEKVGAESDIVRLYLASMDIRSQHKNFDINDFVRQYNHTISWIIQSILKPLVNISAPGQETCDTRLLQQFENMLAMLTAALKPEQFHPHDGVRVITAWLDVKADGDNYFWWLKGLAILLFPFMPQLSQRLWTALGYRHYPRANDFLACPETSIKKKLSINIKLINANLLQKCVNEVLDEAL